MRGRLVLVIVALAIVVTPAVKSAEPHRQWSVTTPGPHAILPATPDWFTVSDGTRISYAVHMPEVPPGTRVPVILTAGPYFAHSEEPVHERSSDRLSGFLIENYVPHGYAVVSASVRGTGWSGGCMELMSEREARDLDELVTFLAGEPWSSGRVGMIGKSYDGSTPWMVAQFGNPHLKTIVPIAGLTDPAGLLVRQGVAQFRTPIFHPFVYWPFGFDSQDRSTEDKAANANCPEMAQGSVAGAWSSYTGDTRAAPYASDYWEERRFGARALDAYEGSVFVVHGLTDWNVLPSQVAPFFAELSQEKKLLLGQWGHHYPDESRIATPRMDFASVLHAWFDRHLKQLPVATGPVAEVADAATGAWRAYPDWPAPTGARAWHLSEESRLVEGSPTPFVAPIANPDDVRLRYGPCFHRGAVGFFESAKLATAFRYSGVATLDLDLATPGPATVGVTVCAGSDIIARGTARADAGATTLRVDLEPVERSVPAGVKVGLLVLSEGIDTVPGAWLPTVIEGGTLTLPTS